MSPAVHAVFVQEHDPDTERLLNRQCASVHADRQEAERAAEVELAGLSRLITSRIRCVVAEVEVSAEEYARVRRLQR
jgi:hypothetical protein